MMGHQTMMVKRTLLLLSVMVATLLAASGVALAVNRVGTNGDDTLRGTDGADNLSGLGGQDNLFGKGGSDNLSGGPGKDLLLGGRGGDGNLDGGSGNDAVVGGQGSDNMSGDDGNDFLVDGALRESSRDNISGGNGGDVIIANHAPAFRDLVSCGGGFDRVLADRKDTVARDCEKVKIVRGSREEVRDQEDAFFESLPESFLAGLPGF